MAALRPLPDDFAITRDALHRVAEEVVAPARKPDNEIALQITPGGFGTPRFEHDGTSVQVRVDGPELVVERDGAERRTSLTSVAEAARFAGADLFPAGMPYDESVLAIDPEAARTLGAFYAFANQALSRSRERAGEGAGPINLWPEHFDVAFEAGDESRGLRANLGASPGDETHPEPYLYFGPWTARPQGPLWNGSGFPGAELRYAELLGSDDASGLALEFFDSRRNALAAG